MRRDIQKKGLTQVSVKQMRGMHTDYPYGHNSPNDLRHPRELFTCQAIWMLDEFTEANGGTYIVPRSQKRGRGCKSGWAEDQGGANQDDAVVSQLACQLTLFRIFLS